MAYFHENSAFPGWKNKKIKKYPTTIGFQLGHLKNGPYTYTVSGGNGRVF